MKGEGNQQDYGMRIYDLRLGRFLSVDPITAQYPELTPYQFASNSPVQGIDLDGLELVNAQKAPGYMELIYGKPVLKTGSLYQVMRDLGYGVQSSKPPPTIKPRGDEFGYALRRAEHAYQEEMNSRAQLDMVSYGGAGFGQGLARDPVMQMSAMSIVPETGVVLGGLQLAYGVKEGDYVKAGLGALTALGSGSGLFAKSVSRPLFLRSQEAWGGHTIARHVGRTDAELFARLSSDLNIKAASTFNDLVTAESVVLKAIDGNKSRIVRWLSGGGRGNLTLDYSGSQVIGRGITRGESTVSHLTNARVVLKGDAKGGYNGLTAFPQQ